MENEDSQQEIDGNERNTKEDSRAGNNAGNDSARDIGNSMHSTTSRNEKILLNFAASPISIKTPKCMEILLRLESKYPRDLAIKRKIVDFYVENGLFEKALFKLLFVARTSLENKDIEKLIFLSFRCNSIDCIFYENNFISTITKRTSYSEANTIYYRNVLEVLRNKVGVVDFTKFIKKENVRNIPGDVTKDYSFNYSYTRLLKCIEENKILEFFEIARNIFKEGGMHNHETDFYYSDVIQFLVDGGKVELLFFLSEKYPFFEKYFLKAVENISKELMTLFETVLSVGNLENVVCLANLMQESKKEKRMKSVDLEGISY